MKIIQCGPTHPAVVSFINLKANKGPNTKKLITLEGLWEILSAKERGCSIEEVFVSEESMITEELKSLYEKLKSEAKIIYTISHKTAVKISDRDNPDGIFALTILKISELNDIVPEKFRKITILDGLEIPGNVGTILRSADGAGIQAAILTNRKVRFTHPKILHASMGACFNIALSESSTADCIAWLEQNNYRIFLADAREDAINLLESDKANQLQHEFLNPKTPLALVMGSEKYGVDPLWYKTIHTKICFPMAGTVDSLNVASAATLIYYYFYNG